MKQTGRAYPELTGVGAKTPGQLGIENQDRFFDTTAVALHIEQPKRSRGLVHIPQHLAEELLMLLLAHTESGLGHQVAIRERCGQQILLSSQMRLYLLVHHGENAVIAHQMLEQHLHQPTIHLLIVGDKDSQQGRLADIDAEASRVEARI